MITKNFSMRLCVSLFLLAGADNAQAGFVAPGSVVEGKTIAEWTGEWWNWLVKEPFETNPSADPTGEFANRNQSGPVFFVGGSFGGPTDERTFTVSAGKYLLVPVFNYVFWAPEDGADEAAIRATAASNVDSVANPYLEIDGVSLPNPMDYRETSPAGGFTLFDSPLLQQIGLPPMDRLAVSDGYWVMLEPLSVGTHTLRFGGIQLGQFENNVVAHITVTPVPEPGSLLITGIGMLALVVSRRQRNDRI